MQTTFIIKNLTPETIDSIMAMQPFEAHNQLFKWAFGDLKHCVSQKCGSGAFRDRAEWNGIIRDAKSGAKSLKFKIEPRKGYKLITFENV